VKILDFLTITFRFIMIHGCFIWQVYELKQLMYSEPVNNLMSKNFSLKHWKANSDLVWHIHLDEWVFFPYLNDYHRAFKGNFNVIVKGCFKQIKYRYKKSFCRFYTTFTQSGTSKLLKLKQTNEKGVNYNFGSVLKPLRIAFVKMFG